MVRSNAVPIMMRSSKNADDKYSPNALKFLHSSKSGLQILPGYLMAFRAYLINLVNIPGAGAQPKGRPIAIKYSLSILN